MFPDGPALTIDGLAVDVYATASVHLSLNPHRHSLPRTWDTPSILELPCDLCVCIPEAAPIPFRTPDFVPG